MIKPWLIALRDVLLYVLDGLIAGWPGRDRQDDATLVTVRLDEIGDFVLWLDAAKAIRRKYGSRRLVLVGNAVWHDLAVRLPWFDEVIALDVRRLRTDLFYRVRQLARLRRLPCGIVLHPVHSREQHLIDAESVVRVLRARQKIGSTGDAAPSWRSRASARTYTRLVSAGAANLMELQRNALFLRSWDLPDHEAGLPDLGIRPSPPEPLTTGEFYVLVPGSKLALKQWPATAFGEMATRLSARTGWKGVVCGTDAERPLARQVCESTRAPLESWSGRTTVTELVGIVARARLVVSNDSAAVHIAAALGVPCVCVLGGGHFGRFLPYDAAAANGRRVPVAVFNAMPCFHCNWACIYSPPAGQAAPCVSGVHPDDVWREIVRMTGSGDPTPSSMGPR